MDAKIRLSSYLLNIFFLFLLVILLFFTCLPVLAQPQTERVLLTVDLLQERLHNPVFEDGKLFVDLRFMVVDLRPENGEFASQFYQLLRKELSKTGSGKSLGLDLSDAVIQGDFVGSDLGIRTSLYPQVISPSFSPGEQEQLAQLKGVCLQSLGLGFASGRDCKSLLGTQSTASSDIYVFRGGLTIRRTRFNGMVSFANTFFLQPVDAEGAIFQGVSNWTETRFSRTVNFSGAVFRQSAQWGGSIFFDKADWKLVKFQNGVYFQGSSFEDNVNFTQAVFTGLAKFSRSQWWGNTDFSQVRFAGQVQYTRSHFHGFLLLIETTFEQAVTFRAAQFQQPVTFRGASILNQADFSDVEFSKSAYLNVSGLGFNSNQAKFLGNPNQIGKMLVVSSLQGNQSVLRNLAQNFRSLQQIGDVNQLEYTKQQLRLQELTHLLTGININSASPETLIRLGFNFHQVSAILSRRELQPFRDKTELLALPEVDFNTYIQLNEQLMFGEPLLVGGWLLHAWTWLCLSLLLLLSGYGTSFWLVFGVGIMAIAYFGLLFWFIDRLRRFRPVAILPTTDETIAMFTSFFCLNLLGILAVFRNSENPLLTLMCLGLIIVPIPLFLVIRLYLVGRYHNQLHVTYFTEDSSMRQLRLLIGRLPVIPRYIGFRDRYLSILWEKRWNWLNYYDFSMNNLLRIGFNDIRLRDEDVPGIISSLAWYEWSLGVLYITLVLWTLSRTIPGLNLLIYLK